MSNGGRFGGYGLYLLKGKPVFVWNLLDLKRVRWAGPDTLSAGKHTIEFDFKYDGLGFATLAFNEMSGVGRGGTGALKVDGKVVATQTMDRTVPFTLQWDETFDIGADTGTPVDDHDYQVPFLRSPARLTSLPSRSMSRSSRQMMFRNWELPIGPRRTQTSARLVAERV
jgi:arylsulfatase